MIIVLVFFVNEISSYSFKSIGKIRYSVASYVYKTIKNNQFQVNWFGESESEW